MPTLTRTGGRWDPGDGPIIFIASNISTLQCASPDCNKLIAVNELGRDADLDVIEGWIGEGRRVFIDSGIFNLTNAHARAHACSMDHALGLAPDQIDGFQGLWDRYIRIINRLGDRCWGYIELDQGGRDNKVRTREKLEALGLRPIPVYHPINDGWDYFDYLAGRYDRICLGNVVQARNPARARIMATIAERRRDYPNLWIHALGVGPVPLLLSVGTDSADASSWLSPIRWPAWPACASFAKAAELPERYFYKRGAAGDADNGHKGLRRLLSDDIVWADRMARSHAASLREAFQ